MIDGVLLTPQKRIATPAGDVLHALKRSSPGFAGFAEAYFSQIHEGVTKPWRRHSRVTLNLVVPHGNVRFVVHDDRPESRTNGAFEEHVLGERAYERLTVAPRVWLAFQGAGPGMATILNIIDEEHDPTEGEARPLDAFSYPW